MVKKTQEKDKMAIMECKREAQEQERLDKIHFQMIKWDLYRLRRQQEEDAYYDDLRMQKRIKMWLQIALR